MANDQPHGGPVRCNAKAKSTGKRCRQYAVPGSTKCHYHGGKSPKGIASPNFRTGRHSKFLPERMLQSYMDAQQDTELISLRAELSVVDARISDLLSRVDTGEAGRIWKAAVQAWDSYKRARYSANPDLLIAAEHDLDGLLHDGLDDYAAWSEVEDLINLRRRLASDERRRLVDMQQMMSYEQGMTMASALLEAVRSSVTDRAQLAEIQMNFTRLMGSATHPAQAGLQAD